jgi:endonuclease/exonuclease/phosphatase family metal-dependent hydrolase
MLQHRLTTIVASLFMLLIGPGIVPAAEPGESSLTVLSFNIRYDNPGDGPNRWQHRAEAVAGIIDQADLAGLQEVVHGQLTDLKKALPAFDSVGVARNDGKQAGEYCPILYRRERFDLRDSGTFWLSTEPDKIGSRGWDASLPRICTWAQLFDKQTEQEFYFFNTHFDHRGPEARLESGKLIARKVRELAGESPALLSGDFNSTPESEPIQAILHAADQPLRLLDSRASSKAKPVGPNTTWNGFSKIVPNRRIDFIFTRGAVEVLSYREITTQLDDGRFPSDHLPVAVEVLVRE